MLKADVYGIYIKSFIIYMIASMVELRIAVIFKIMFHKRISGTSA